MITAAWLLLIGIGLGNTAVTATGAAVTLLASLPELGRLSWHEIAALVHDAGFATAKDREMTVAACELVLAALVAEQRISRSDESGWAKARPLRKTYGEES